MVNNSLKVIRIPKIKKVYVIQILVPQTSSNSNNPQPSNNHNNRSQQQKYSQQNNTQQQRNQQRINQQIPPQYYYNQYQSPLIQTFTTYDRYDPYGYNYRHDPYGYNYGPTIFRPSTLGLGIGGVYINQPYPQNYQNYYQNNNGPQQQYQNNNVPQQ